MSLRAKSLAVVYDISILKRVRKKWKIFCKDGLHLRSGCDGSCKAKSAKAKPSTSTPKMARSSFARNNLKEGPVRKRVNKTEVINARVSAALKEALGDFARSRGEGMAVIIRGALSDFCVKNGIRVKENVS